MQKTHCKIKITINILFKQKFFVDEYLLEAPIFTKELSAAEVKHADKVRLKKT